MASLVILPAEPVPETLLRSKLFSLAILRTRGEERTRSPVSVSLVSPVSPSASVVAGVAAAGAGWALGAGVAPAVPPTLMAATTVLIWTVVPACTLISESTPAAGEGISASTLSVEISKRGSSCCTASPGFFNHLVMVPSKIDSPIWGMITSVGMDSLSTRTPYFKAVSQLLWRDKDREEWFSVRENQDEAYRFGPHPLRTA